MGSPTSKSLFPEPSTSTRTQLLLLDESTPIAHGVPPELEPIGSAKVPNAHVHAEGSTAYRGKIVIARGEVTIAALDDGASIRVNDEPLVGSRVLAPSDAVTIGSQTFAFHAKSPTNLADCVTPLSVFQQNLAASVVRAQRSGRPLSLVLFVTGIELDEARGELAEIVSGLLRSTDQFAWGDNDELLVILAASAEAAHAPARRILQALRSVSSGARGGLSSAPADGLTAEALLRGARNAARAAASGRILAVSEMGSSLAIGEHWAIAADPAMKSVFSLVERLALSATPVLITGETGAGKELVSAAIHHWSPRRRHRLVAVNCAALADGLIESELFGHEKGSFSGAIAAKSGLFEVADGGTLLLDEVGELSPVAQAKLLRVLDTKRIMRVGAVQERPVDVRVVAATHRTLSDEVAQGRFRRDLFFRLGAATVRVPPLRERPADLPVLAQSFLRDACERLSRSTLVISPAAMKILSEFPWPGNVRELKNTMDFLAATTPGAALDADALGAFLEREGRLFEGTVPASQAEDLPHAAPAHSPHASPGTCDIYEEIRALERLRITEALEAADGVRVRAAERIGMPLRTFASKVKEYGIQYFAHPRVASKPDGGHG